MRVVAVCVLALCAMSGCSSFLHFSSPQAQLVTCEITGAILPLLEDLAATLGIPLQVIESLYGEGCQVAAERGMSQADAEKFGLQHAQIHAMKMAAEKRDAGAP